MVGPAVLREAVVGADVGVEAEVDFEIGAQVGTVALAAVLLAERKIHLRLRPMDGRP